MERYPDYTRTRIRQLAERIQERIYADRRPADRILVSPRVDRISYDEAQKLKFKPARLGDQFGPLWATFWFRVTATVPKDWSGRRVDFLWKSWSEATLWHNGRSIQGLNWTAGDRPDAVILPKARGGETIELQVEMACNQKFGLHHRKPFEHVSPFVLDQCEIAAFDPAAWEMYFDLLVLKDLEAEMAREQATSDAAWAGELLFELNRFANTLDLDDQSTWKPAQAILKALYKRHNATRAHELSAIGHAHIDTAWLWPLAETHRKCERTFSTQTRYMEDYPDFRFACSQAYQYQVMKERNPDLYRRIRAKVKAGQFIPVGGTWIEPDCNIPSGESLVRQFLVGQRFFEKEFGIRCREFWNPDVFGYNGQLPQIMRLAGITRFLTQKLSWNRFNKPHHHTFTWQGIDGSQVLAHFPPADTYNAVADVKELRKNAREYKDHERGRHSLMLFGYGDGGGGPTKRMLETLRRARDLQGLPRTQMRTSDEFFELLENDLSDRPTLIGELYFEYHRGTYTSQAAVKRGNRKGEIALHDAEFLSTVASLGGRRAKSFAYPADELQRLWKLLLLNQFHDILPGSSIALVYEDAERDLAEVGEKAAALAEAAGDAVAGSGGNGSARSRRTPINTIGFGRSEVVRLPTGRLAFVDAPSYGIGAIVDHPERVTLAEKGRRIVLENSFLRATLSATGQLVSLIDKATGREALAGEGNALKLYDDHPTEYDAWDVDPFHMETERDAEPAHALSPRLDPSGLRAEVTFERRIGKNSTMSQSVRLDASARRLEFHCDVEWRESHTMLKAVFPVNVRAMNATYEMQFGCVERPTHFNTSYDLARYEVPGHRWSDLSEHGFGVALLSESKYGFSTFGNVMRLSLLRSPKSPDPNADMGRHRFAYAILPHAGDWRQGQVVAEGYRFNVPIRFAAGREAVEPMSFASVDDPNLVIDTIKRSEDGSGIIVRLYECHGARGEARLSVALPFRHATGCNILEEPQGTAPKVRGENILLPYRPFELISLKLT